MTSNPQSIRSSSNAAFRLAREVARGKVPGSTVLEGVRLVGDALRAGSELQAVWVREDRLEEWSSLAAESGFSSAVPAYSAAPALYSRLGSVKNPPPVLAIAKSPAFANLGALDHGGQPLGLVVAGVQDPGNLGALARSAEAAGARFLVQVGTGVGPFQAKALRGSMGSLLRLPVCSYADASSAKAALDGLGYRHLCAATRGGDAFAGTDWSGKLALWISGETGEAPEEMQGMQGVTIPLASPVESLNVTVAGSLLLFAASRVSIDKGSL